MKEISKQTIIYNLIQIIFIVLFISISTTLFGQQEQLTAVAAVTGLLMFYYVPLPINPKAGSLLVSLPWPIIGLVSYLASLNSWAGFILNFTTLFILTLLMGKPFHFKYYIAYTLLYIFSATSIESNFNLSKRIIYLSLVGIISFITYLVKHRQTQNDTPLKTMIKEALNDTPLIHFSIKMSLGISLVLLIASLNFFDKSMWICMTVMSLTQLDSNVMKKRMLHRTFGTLIGIVCYLILFRFIVPTHYAIYLTLILGYVYTFIEDYFIQIIFITMNALFAAQAIWPTSGAVIHRVSFILIGACLVAILHFISHSFSKASKNKTT
ncbi:FUSC family protein [Vagococcus sp. PNs007]|uniref:FUSC family protein n=1 Tax=Vagococcus proximus TaxID=2991417 RepID=A0ABT5X2Z7_9ENTE|nr:FUSC family protein [Vagococcus proximus]MDF0480377.1 FUSC family protein [Vagococcus proximus]